MPKANLVKFLDMIGASITMLNKKGEKERLIITIKRRYRRAPQLGRYFLCIYFKEKPFKNL